MIPSSRQSLIDYALRKLGEPVVKVNVAQEQLEDSLDDTLQMFTEYHFAGLEKIFFRHALTAEDIENEYISVPENLFNISSLLPISSSGSDPLFNVEYQMRMSNWDLFYGSGFDIQYYTHTQQWLKLTNDILNPAPPFRFNKIIGRLHIDIGSWGNHFATGNYIVGEGYGTINPNEHTKVFNNIFVKQYFVALVKYQWGQNLSKFSGAQLAGGVTINGETIMSDAKEEITKIEEDILTKFSEPPSFFVG